MARRGTASRELRISVGLATGDDSANLQSIIDSLPVGILFITGADPTTAIVVAANAAAREIAGIELSPGFTLQEFIHASSFYPPDRKAPLPMADLPSMRALERGETVRQREIHLHRPDGQWRVILAGATPLRLDGHIAGAVAIFQDITGQKRMEKHRRFLAEASAVLASSLDVETTLRHVAQLAVPSLADWCFVDLLENEDNFRRLAVAHADPAKTAMARRLRRSYSLRQDIPYGIPKALIKGEPTLAVEIDETKLSSIAYDSELLELFLAIGVTSFLTVPMQARKQILGAITLVAAESGCSYGPDDLALAKELARIAAMSIDNARFRDSEQRAREEAQQANKAKDQFLAVITHELRNPLAAIQAGMDILKRETLQEGRVQRTIEIIDRSVRLQTRLLDDLQDLTRITRGKIRLQRKHVPLDRSILAAIQSYQEAAIKAGLTLTANVQPDLLVHGDPDRLQQILANLLNNAITFTPPGGEISVSLIKIVHGEDLEPQTAGKVEAQGQPRGEYARIVVQDTGIGIDRSLVEHLFEMFWQGGAGAQRGPGLGVGLALVKSLTEMHEGRVWAESEGPGKGSRFIIELPLITAEDSSTPDKSYEEEPKTTRLLLVEDNSNVRTLLTDVLEKACYVVNAAASAEEALRLLPQTHPDAIIADTELPGMDAYTFLRRVRQMPDLAEVIAFALVSPGRDEDITRALEAGYTGHLLKPADANVIDQRIQELLEAGIAEPRDIPGGS